MSGALDALARSAAPCEALRSREKLMASGAIAVTGSAGLIGFAVASRLAREGRDVIGTDRIQPREDGGFPSTDAELTDVHKLHAICGSDIKAIVHCGAVSGPMLGRDNPRAVIETNVAGTANLLEIARQTISTAPPRHPATS